MTDFPAQGNWIKSSVSDPNGGQCVEVAPAHASATGVVPLRDSKRPDGPILTLSPEAFAALVTFARNADLS
ncbi:DUF397 domain-containing protein [Streptomyces sp. NPDC048290]|uniref:DUF397 domain-containing protein n=1 Tax=Streptomyces sp. NPDC048290 TaxID=3155811 RepID=UPI00342246A4